MVPRTSRYESGGNRPAAFTENAIRFIRNVLLVASIAASPQVAENFRTFTNTGKTGIEFDGNVFDRAFMAASAPSTYLAEGSDVLVRVFDQDQLPYK